MDEEEYFPDGQEEQYEQYAGDVIVSAEAEAIEKSIYPQINEPPEGACTCNPCECDPPPHDAKPNNSLRPEGACTCNPCECTTPPDDDTFGEDYGTEQEEEEEPAKEPEPNYNLNDFVRAKEFFMSSSTKTGISLYDHFSELIRKLLDNRAPENPIDFVEEISLNLKRYRFGMVKDVIQDSYYLSKQVVETSDDVISNWRKNAMWSKEAGENAEENNSMGGFPNLLRLQYYLEQINIGLPREEMFKVALFLREVRVNNPVSRIRFWGKIFGIKGNYYVFEAEVKEGEALGNTWASKTEENNMDENEELYDPTNNVPGAGATFQRAGGAVTNPEVLSAYRQSSGIAGPEPPPNSGTVGQEYLGEEPSYAFSDPTEAKEAARWEEYQLELMSGFPQPPEDGGPPAEPPPEDEGKGINRRVFFVWSEWGARAREGRPEAIGWNARASYGSSPETQQSECIPLGIVKPSQIDISRRVRWFLTGDLNEKVRTFPEFQGKEGDYLRALLARITAGTSVSPRGYYRTSKYGDEDGGEDEEEVEEEEEESTREDIVYAKKKFRPENINDLTNPSVDLWVHHASHILRQGRTVWFNMDKAKKKTTDEEDDDEDVEEEEEEDEENGPKNKEIGPPLFTSLAEDKTWEGTSPWSARPSSSVFTEFQVAHVRSNLWPGANALCTVKGKVENIYLGDGLKFSGRAYAPFVPEEPQMEYRDGPELTEIPDPTVEQEQEWLAKLQLDEIADVEDKFVDNEEEGEDDEEEEEDED